MPHTLHHARRTPYTLVAAALLGLAQLAAAAPPVGTLEEVARLPIRPGNVTATNAGRVFATVHPLDKPSGVQLMEVTGPDAYRPWPDASYQSAADNKGDDRIDTPLGIAQDKANRLWIVDMGLNLGKTRVWAFDIASGKLAHKFTLPADVAPKGAFVQDLAVDSERGWGYLADIAPPALIALNIKTGEARRFSASPTLLADPKAVMKVDGKPTLFGGKPASIGVNPLTLSKDGETLYFGAMNGLKWYGVPTHLFRDGADDRSIAAAIRSVGRKPVSDGVATDDAGNHFFTNLNANGIDRLDRRGRLKPLVRDARLSWPDNAQFGPESWLYVSVNQLHKTSAFTGGDDLGQPPYRIMRVWTGTGGNARR
ncbi:L-dopachrome tautomerase-related protein [Accumulibacter sp.]|uniref:L-dopachrome tautomerase-related protein n=1 Tax=Accumulibacter sp. TaxID=2053492 RepID=UPI002614906F|nr:L-dopachrome tautomerase-related protein [Accumulibacter sp.]